MISGTILVFETLRRLSLWASIFQLVGTALIVWGLKITTDTGASYLLLEESKKPLSHAGIVREHAWAVTWGVWLLLLGLALQVVTAVL
jgi:hypothetical protein